MRCLHCGNEVSLLKKLSDAQFCSAEHRQQFYDDQQRLMLQRLQASASRLQRFRRGSLSPAVVSVVSAQIAADVIAPAGIAAFCTQDPPTAFTRPFSLMMLAAFDFPGVQAIPPQRIATPPVITASLSSAVFDIPWAKYNPGLQSFPPLDPVFAMFDIIVDGLSRMVPIRDWRGLSASQLVPLRSLDPSESVLNQPMRPLDPSLDLSVEPSWELLALTPDLDAPRLRRISASPGVTLPGLQGSSLSAPGIAESNALPRPAGTLSLLMGESGLGLSTLRFDPLLPHRGIAFLDRVFRMRPRSGIPGKNVPAFCAIEPETENYPALEPSRTSIQLSAAGTAPEPSRTGKFFRARPRGPVEGVTAILENASHPEAFAVCLNLPDLLTPGLSTKDATGPDLVRSSTQAAYAIATAAPFLGPQHHPIAAVDVASTLQAATPSTAPNRASRELVPSSHLYRGQLDGPVADPNFAAFVPIPGTVSAAAEAPRLMFPPSRHAKADFTAFAPVRVERLFRMRPRAGIPDQKVTGLAVICEAAHLCSGPAIPTTRFARDFVPAQVSKLFRGRPRGPVTGFVREFEAVEAGAAIVPAGFPALAGRETPAGETGLPLAIGMYRAGPTGPVCPPLDTALAVRLTLAPELLTSTPAMPEATAQTHLVPRPIEKLYRNRGRGPVSRAELAAMEPIATGGGIGFVSQSAYPAHTAAARNLSPNPAAQLFRMRPHSGVTSSAAALQQTAGLLQANVQPEPFPAWQALSPVTPTPAVSALSVRATQRLYRMRPKSGVPGAAATLTIMAAAEDFAGRPRIVDAPLADCVPVQIRRMFRPRPATAVQGGTGLACAVSTLLISDPLHIDLELALGSYLLGHGVAPAPAFLNRMFRMRPRLPLQDGDTMMAKIRFKQLPTPEPEALFPTLSCDILDDPAPEMLDKLYRMRPRAGRQGAAENLPIGCEPMIVECGPDALVCPIPLENAPRPTAKDALRSFSKNWKTAPVDLKAMVMAVPVLLFVSLVPLGSKPTVVQANTLETDSFQTVVSSHMDRVGRDIRSRAAIGVEEDFRSGLDRWTGAEGWQGSWSEHPSGWVSPGKLAILAPSVALSDYRLEFSGQIISRALSFVVRAADADNYQAIKFKLSRKSLMPRLIIVRTTVIAGKEVSRKEMPLPLHVAPDRIYHVTLDANDQDFTLMIEDKVVDFWSDAQLKSGGIGFFADEGEKALIHNVRVRHHYDTLGRLVAAAFPAER